MYRFLFSCHNKRPPYDKIFYHRRPSKTLFTEKVSHSQIFGIAPNPGATLPYLQVNKGHYWVGDSNSPYYNSLVDINQIGYIFNTSVSEHIISYGNVYNYCIAIGYNKEKIPYKGSAIFLHCSGAGATAGCVSIPEDAMVRIIQNIKDDAMIIIDTPSNMRKY